jgi:hypothetical protein
MRKEGCTNREMVVANIIVSNHGQKRTPQLVGLQLGFGVESEYESTEIGAILFKLPLALHLNER